MLKRIAPYFPLASAALIFLSWTLSNGLNEQEQAARARVKAVIDDVRGYRLYRAQTSRLDRIAADVRVLLEQNDSEKATSSHLSWFNRRRGSIQFEIGQADDLRTSVHSLAALVDAQPTLTFLLAVADAEMTEIQKEAKETGEDLIKKAKAIKWDDDAASHALEQAMLDGVSQLFDGMDAVVTEYEAVGAYLEQPTQDLLKTLERRALIARLLAAVAFVAGTLLALYGKTVEIRGQRS